MKFISVLRLSIRAGDETLSVAMLIRNPDYSPFKIESRDPAQALTGFVEIVIAVQVGNEWPRVVPQTQ